MREILFRAWDKQYKTMCKVDMILFNTNEIMTDNNYGEPKSLEHYELMQFTGEFDMHEVKIFEGDRVILLQSNREYVVKYKNGCFQLFHADPILNDMLWGSLQKIKDLLWDIKIIGNIHEGGNNG